MRTKEFDTADIIEFYNDTAWEYRFFWSDFNLHYGFYDDNHTTHREAMENSNRIYAEKLDVDSTDTVLDIGTGRGGLPVWIGEHVGADVHGIDIDPLHVGEARDNARRRDTTGTTEFSVANFNEIPYPDDTFDTLSGVETVCHAEDKRAVLREVRRVLKPGGRIMISDGYLNERDLTPEQWETVQKLLDGWAVPQFFHVEDFRDVLEDIGFVNVEFDDHYERILPSSRRQYRLSLAITPLLKVASALGVKSELSVDQGIALYHQYDTIKNGLAVHGDFTADLPK